MIVIREASESDVAAIAEIEKKSINHPWPVEALYEFIGVDNKTMLAAVDDENGDVAGYADADWVVPEASVGNIAVRPGMRRRGIGRKLLEELMKTLKAKGNKVVFLEVAEGNIPAKCLYESCGFETISRRKDYYGSGIDALVMKARL